MIRLEITNPHEHTPAELLPLIGYLSSLAGQPVPHAPTQLPEPSPAAAQVFAAGAPVIPSAPAAPDTEPDESDSSVNTSDVSGVLDSAGQPWDARIHSGGKSTIADGTWRLKKGVDAALVDQVRAEHAGAPAAPAAPAIPTAPAAPAVEPAPQAAPSAPVAPSAPTAPAGDAVSVQTVFGYISAKKLQPADIAAALGDVMGITAPSQLLPLKDDPAQLGTALELLKAVHGA